MIAAATHTNAPSVLPTPPRSLVRYGLAVARGLLFLLFAGMLTAVLLPDVRAQVKGAFTKDYRVIVSTAKGDLLGNGTIMTVAKIKTQNALYLEIYEPLTGGGQRLVERIELPDHKDGFFNFNGEATNLAIDDIEGDGHREILAPSFDKNLVGHLNVYRYSADAHEFQRLLR